MGLEGIDTPPEDKNVPR